MPEAASDLRQGACGLEAEAVPQSRLSRHETQAATLQEAEATLAAPPAERLPGPKVWGSPGVSELTASREERFAVPPCGVQERTRGGR